MPATIGLTSMAATNHPAPDLPRLLAHHPHAMASTSQITAIAILPPIVEMDRTKALAITSTQAAEISMGF
ncbi:MAG: hypothetical protein RR855_11965 [Comamonas sp.]